MPGRKRHFSAPSFRKAHWQFFSSQQRGRVGYPPANNTAVHERVIVVHNAKVQQFHALSLLSAESCSTSVATVPACPVPSAPRAPRCRCRLRQLPLSLQGHIATVTSSGCASFASSRSGLASASAYRFLFSLHHRRQG